MATSTKSAKQAVAKAQPKKTKPTDVTKESSVKIKTKADKPNKRTLPSNADKKSKLATRHGPIDTGDPAANSNKVQNKNLPKRAKTSDRTYKKSKQTPYT